MMKIRGYGERNPHQVARSEKWKNSVFSFRGTEGETCSPKERKIPLLFKPKISVIGYRILSESQFFTKRSFGEITINGKGDAAMGKEAETE